MNTFDLICGVGFTYAAESISLRVGFHAEYAQAQVMIIFHITYRLGIPSLFCRRFEFALQKDLENSNTFLSAIDASCAEEIKKQQPPQTKLNLPLSLVCKQPGYVTCITYCVCRYFIIAGSLLSSLLHQTSIKPPP